MKTTTISVTEAARNFADCVNPPTIKTSRLYWDARNCSRPAAQSRFQIPCHSSQQYYLLLRKGFPSSFSVGLATRTSSCGTRYFGPLARRQGRIGSGRLSCPAAAMPGLEAPNTGVVQLSALRIVCSALLIVLGLVVLPLVPVDRKSTRLNS